MKPVTNTIFSAFFIALFFACLFAGCAHQKHANIASAETVSSSTQKQDLQSTSTEHAADGGEGVNQETYDTDNEAADETEDVQIADPLSFFNRGMYNFNDKLYFWILKPVAKGYASIVPEKGRISVRNFFNNLAFPVRFVSNVMQAKGKSAVIEFARFGVNSTIGIVGLNDIAKKGLNLEVPDEDIGQALGYYKIGHGFYIVWPLLGPSSLRDTIGFIGDIFLYPVSYINPAETSAGISAYENVNNVSLHIGDYESLKEAAIDPYTSIRNAYIQNRKKKVEE
ncbi:MAG: VacJ family lipoprotein [Nitrospirae bacterium]|nr:VacJ family lipoprotein [Nitrospirota bacterium]